MLDILLSYNGLPFMVIMIALGAGFFLLMKRRVDKNKIDNKDVED